MSKNQLSLSVIVPARNAQATLGRALPVWKRPGRGDIELIDVIGNRVLVAPRGACAVCKASEQTLKNLVEAKLRELVWPELTVEEAAS